jgi:phosphinothricin acetyltransferase
MSDLTRPASFGVPASLRIRDAEPGDAAAIAEIYNDGIRGRAATFETAERTADDVVRWLESPANVRRPFLVAERAGEVVGWVRGSEYRARACYDGVAEVSAYVAASARGQRVGDALMARFVSACEESGIWKILSRVFPENTASRALCARHGFREVGVYERHAQLDGVWRDVIIVERLIPRNQL